LFITEEKLVVSRIGAIIEHPVVTRMVSIFLSLCTSIDNAELRRSGDEKHRSFICRAFLIGVNKIYEGWYPSQVNNLIIFLKVTWGFLSACRIRESIYGGY
jgi:hypothetical protein